ncbi:unannotated protein [freshwater metagenome]|uniref:Unannotated protein n=1 Tax=freshwater metagenome TaxID=449393 RepID=A0A6J7BLG9_9ZZZZ
MLGVLRAKLQFGQLAKDTVDAYPGGGAHLAVQVRSAALDEGAQQREHGHRPTRGVGVAGNGI